MDETAYRQLYSEVTERRCAFEKAVLLNCAACSCSGRLQIAEREAATCCSAANLARCVSLHDSLRKNFSFALGKPASDDPLPHAQELRVQCGGLKGLQSVMHGTAEVEDVATLLDAALLRWKTIAGMPYSEIVRAAALCYKGRHG